MIEATQAIKQAEKSINSLNKNVSGDIQTLFERMGHMYPCKWRGNSIVVLDEYVIHPPYDKVEVLENCDGAGLHRLIMKLEGERRKLNLS